MENSNPQTFADLVANFSHIRLATKEDNQAILDFYKNETMKTGEETISFDRGEDFFAFYELTTNKYWCFLFLNKDNSIGGIGSILRHHRQVNGQFIPVAYFCDLRISASSSRITKIQCVSSLMLSLIIFKTLIKRNTVSLHILRYWPIIMMPLIL